MKCGARQTGHEPLRRSSLGLPDTAELLGVAEADNLKARWPGVSGQRLAFFVKRDRTVRLHRPG